MTLELLKDKLESNGLLRYFEPLRALLRTTIRLYPSVADENKWVAGQTRIGGMPDLPEAMTWPVVTKEERVQSRILGVIKREQQKTITRSLSFVAQVNLQELAACNAEGQLPDSGMLYFFYTPEQDAWGFRPSDKDDFKVVYWSGDTTTMRQRAFPADLPEYGRYAPATVTVKQEISLPSPGSEVYEILQEEDEDLYWDKIYDAGNTNKLLGYADTIQDEMELECELVTNGLYCGDGSGYADPRAGALRPHAKQWRLLLQVDSNDEQGMMWGDSGRLYFWIRSEDLHNRNFEKSWFCLQCY